jgi:hypothetical protein
MKPALAAHARLETSSLILVDLASSRTPLPEALLRLGAKHAGQPGLRPFRNAVVATQHGTFVHPQEVPGLLTALLTRTAQAFSENTSLEQDLAAAAFLAWGVMAIHPFEDRNGHVALDLAHYALQLRWRLEVPPLALPPDGSQTLGSLFAGMDDRCDGSASALVALAQRVATRIQAGPSSEPALITAAAWLRAALPATPEKAGARP